jgi:glutamine cyclotransferase
MTRGKWLGVVALLIALALAGWLFLTPAADTKPKVYAAEIVATLPHDPQAFTEGLLFRGGMLYESTGEEGTSGIRRVKLDTGEVLARQELGFPYFGEGIVDWKDRLIQVTWKNQTGFVYGIDDFKQRSSFKYDGEGWGMTQDGSSIILSDGTPTLRFLDPETMAQKSTLTVTSEGCPVANLNELEWVDGEIYANIWQTDLIARIDPKTGAVKSFLDVTALGPPNPGTDDVANGIAYDAAGKRLFVTGKMWPQLYQVRAGTTAIESPAAAALGACPAK